MTDMARSFLWLPPLGGSLRAELPAKAGSHTSAGSIFRLRRIDPIDPLEDAALQVLHAREALVDELPDRLGTAAAHLAVDDDVGGVGAGRQLVEPFRQLA